MDDHNPAVERQLRESLASSIPSDKRCLSALLYLSSARARMVPNVLGSTILERFSSQVSSLAEGKGLFFPFVTRSDRRAPVLDSMKDHPKYP